MCGVCALPRAYRPQGGRGHVTSTWQNSNQSAKNSKIHMSVYSTNAAQTATVTIISYKPLSGLNFARYTILIGSYMPSPPLGSISPWLYKPLALQSSSFTVKIFSRISWQMCAATMQVQHTPKGVGRNQP